MAKSKPAKAANTDNNKQKLKTIFEKYAGKEVPVREVRMLGHVFYKPNQEASPLKELREELKAMGYSLLVDEPGGDSIIEEGRAKEDKRVVATVGGKGMSRSLFILDIAAK
jgi:hypothetical protein